MSAEMIEASDRAEEQAAALALRSAKTKDELVSIWWRDCEHFEGSPRERLRQAYSDALVQFAPMQRAG